jgi:hypothetical protein
MPVMAAPLVRQLALGTGPTIQYSIVPVNASGQDGSPSPTTAATNNSTTPNNQVSWNLTPGAEGGYRVLKNGNLLVTVGPGITSFTDNAGSAGTPYVQSVAPNIATLATPGSPSGQSTSAYGSAAAPVAGQAIATYANLPVGTYKVTVYGGFGAGNDQNGNAQLQIGSTVLGRVYMTPSVNGTATPTVFDRVNNTAIQNLTINAVVNASSNSLYNILIMVTPIN